jgi:hypothetical protein
MLQHRSSISFAWIAHEKGWFVFAFLAVHCVWSHHFRVLNWLYCLFKYISCLFNVCSLFISLLFPWWKCRSLFPLTKSRWLEIDSLRRAWPIILGMSFGRFWTSWCILTYFSSPL